MAVASDAGAMDVVLRGDVPDIDDEPEEVEEMTVLSRHHLKEKCVCKLPWCMASREQHKFGQFMTSIPKGDRARCVRWLHSLGHADDEEDFSKLMGKYDTGTSALKVAVIHFYTADTQFRANWKNKGPGRIWVRRTGESKHVEREGQVLDSPGPYRVEGGQHGVKESPNYNTDRDFHRNEVRRHSGGSGAAAAKRALPLPDQATASDIDAKRANINAYYDDAQAACDPDDPDAYDELVIQHRLRSNAQGKHITDFQQVLEHSKKVQDHARHCDGNLSWRIDRMTRHGLSGRMVGTCRDPDCRSKNGNVVYESSKRNEKTGQYFVNDLCATAVATNQIGFEAAACFAEGLFLKMPDQSTSYKFIRETVAPAVAAAKKAEEMRVIQIARDVGHLLLAFDVGHSCVVNAQHSTGVAVDLRTGLAALSRVNSEGSSASRESMIAAVMLYYLTQSEDKVDTPVSMSTRSLR